MNFRQVHLDFHTSEQIPSVGEDFSKENFQKALQLGHIDSITVFAKCHHGWMYYQSDKYPMHPGLKFDLLKEQLDAASEIGVKTPIYISAGLDERLAKEHTEWLRRDKNDCTTWVKDFTTPGYHVICFNSPYLDILLEQIKEVCLKYHPEKIFLDITTPGPCYCSSCRKKLKEMGKSILDEKAVEQLALDTYQNYRKRVRQTIDSVDPSIGVFHNCGHIQRGKSDLLTHISHLEIESLPTGSWGYDYFPMIASYVKQLPFDYLGMTGKFHTWWGEFGGFKHPNALKYETALLLSFGAKCSIGDQLHPSGKMDLATYKLIGKAYEEVEKEEKWSEYTHFISDVAVFPCETFGNPEKAQAVDGGVTRILLENHILFDFVDIETDLSQYKLVVLPDAINLTPLLKDKLKQYVKQGGKILATGESSINFENQQFEFDFGGTYIGKCQYSPCYIHPDFNLDSLDTSDFVVYSQAETVSGNESMAKIRYPYFNRNADHFCSHQHTPCDNIDRSDGILIGPEGAYISYPLFTEYYSIGSIFNKEILRKVVKELLKDEISLSTNLQSQGIVTLMENKNRHQYILHMVYGAPVKRGQIEVIQDLNPVDDISISLKLPKSITRAFLPQNNKEISYQCVNGRVCLSGLDVNCHRIIVLEYE